MFINGQKVVCVDDKFDPSIAALFTALPKEGETYVVRGTTVGTHRKKALGGEREEGVITVYLVGLVNPKGPTGRERGFLSDRFRPLEEITTEEIIGEPEKILVAHEHDDADWWKKAA